MKRSKAIRLVLLGGAGCALAACDQAPPPDARFFADARACAEVYDEAACQKAFAESKASFAAEAPRFSRKEECEAEFGAGNCETRQSGMGSFFMPMMMGYMLGSAFRQPVYRGPDGTAMTRSGNSTYAVGRFSGAGGRGAAFQPTQITQVQRGGFGTTTSSSYRATAGG